ncbi:MAG: hypothetical protein RL684_2774 [Pseudomonadota bacterium]|jgi:hypothetical protein
MSDLNLRPAAIGSFQGDKGIAVPAMDAGNGVDSTARTYMGGRSQRRRLNATRLQFEDSGFRLFRVY